MPLDQKVVLIGPMGAGKSTIGKLLADKLGWTYIDNDSEMTKLTDLNAEELSRLPVKELHRIEAQCLKHVCDRPAPFIAGAAASVVDYPENVKILRSVYAIYLWLPLEQIVERAGLAGIGRENIGERIETVLGERFLRRDPIYREVSKLVVGLGAIPALDVERVFAFLRSQSS